jgi:hypothetical protein
MTPTTIATDATQAFVEACTECERVCFETASHCLTQGGVLADVRGIQLLRNCGRICRTTSVSWSVGSRLYSEVLQACERMCEQAARLCDGLGGDRQLRECAEECRVCAEACREMADSPRAPLSPITPIF